MSETEKFLDYIKQAKSKNTLKSYKVSLRLFEEFYGKSCDEALQERREDVTSGDFERNRRVAREIEKFHAWMLNKAMRLTVRGLTLSELDNSSSSTVCQLF